MYNHKFGLGSNLENSINEDELISMFYDGLITEMSFERDTFPIYFAGESRHVKRGQHRYFLTIKSLGKIEVSAEEYRCVVECATGDSLSPESKYDSDFVLYFSND